MCFGCRCPSRLLSPALRPPLTHPAFVSLHSYGQVGQKAITAEHATHMLYRSLAHDGYSCLILAKNREEPLTFPEGVPHGGYVVCLSSLDADPRSVDQPVCGTIFSVYKRRSSASLPGKYIDLQQKGADQVAAGFVTYGASTVLYYTMGHGLYSFVLHPVALQYFLQPDQRLTIEEANYAIYGKRTIISSPTTLGTGVRRFIEETPNVKMYHTGCMAGNVALMLPNGKMERKKNSPPKNTFTEKYRNKGDVDTSKQTREGQERERIKSPSPFPILC